MIHLFRHYVEKVVNNDGVVIAEVPVKELLFSGAYAVEATNEIERRIKRGRDSSYPDVKYSIEEIP